MSGRFHKLTGHYADSDAGYGARQTPSKLTSKKRYRQREAGEIPPVEYVPLDEAIKAVG